MAKTGFPGIASSDMTSQVPESDEFSILMRNLTTAIRVEVKGLWHHSKTELKKDLVENDTKLSSIDKLQDKNAGTFQLFNRMYKALLAKPLKSGRKPIPEWTRRELLRMVIWASRPENHDYRTKIVNLFKKDGLLREPVIVDSVTLNPPDFFLFMISQAKNVERRMLFPI